MWRYRGYTARVIGEDEAGLFHGEVEHTRDVITFQGRSMAALETAFRASIDEYLDWCAARGKSPETPVAGREDA